jgi:hypothetical protein
LYRSKKFNVKIDYVHSASLSYLEHIRERTEIIIEDMPQPIMEKFVECIVKADAPEIVPEIHPVSEEDDLSWLDD